LLLPRTALRALQRQAVDALLAAGSLAVEVAAQLAASAEPGDRVAVRTLHEAARVLGSSDPGAAADLTRRALELAGLEDPPRGPLAAETALLLHAAGRVEDGKSFADDALSKALSAQQEAEVRLSIAWMIAVSADVRAEASRRALALAGLPGDLRARTWPGSCPTSCRPASRKMAGSCWERRVTPYAQSATPMPPSPSPSPRRCWTTRAAASVPRWTGSRRSALGGPK
jgi:hypothetical protein